MFVKFLTDWRSYREDQIAELKTANEIRCIQFQIDAGVCCEYNPEAPVEKAAPAEKPKRKRRKKAELTEDENEGSTPEPAPKSAMTMGNMFGGDKT